jgi:hypothetical protein
MASAPSLSSPSSTRVLRAAYSAASKSSPSFSLRARAAASVTQGGGGEAPSRRSSFGAVSAQLSDSYKSGSGARRLGKSVL